MCVQELMGENHDRHVLYVFSPEYETWRDCCTHQPGLTAAVLGLAPLAQTGDLGETAEDSLLSHGGA